MGLKSLGFDFRNSNLIDPIQLRWCPENLVTWTLPQLIVTFSASLQKLNPCDSTHDLRTSGSIYLRNAASQAALWTNWSFVFDNILNDSCTCGRHKSAALGEVIQPLFSCKDSALSLEGLGLGPRGESGVGVCVWRQDRKERREDNQACSP